MMYFAQPHIKTLNKTKLLVFQLISLVLNIQPSIVWEMVRHDCINTYPSNAEATFTHSTRMQRFLKTI